jgi:hypothetical protein
MIDAAKMTGITPAMFTRRADSWFPPVVSAARPDALWRTGTVCAAGLLDEDDADDHASGD